MTALAHPTTADLRAIDLFDDLADDELDAWAEAATLHEAAPGERVSEYGEPSRGVILLLDGRLQMLALEGGVETSQGMQQAPTWIGATPVLLGAPVAITLRAEADASYALIPSETFVDLTLAHKPVFRRAIAQMKPVIGRMAQRQQSRDRLESLGTMAAGLAHELNNPASAARRTAGELADALVVLSEATGMFVEAGVSLDQASRLVQLQGEALARAGGEAQAVRSRHDGEFSALDRADREDELGDALSTLGLRDEAWTLNEPLAAGGIDTEYLGRVADTAGPLTVPVLRWIIASVSARQLAAELTTSTEQMSQLVRAIKKYAYMDRGELVEAQLTEGLDTTLTILKHKLKKTRIQIERAYDPGLGPVTVHGAELNQVWTNLLDNAIDALGDSGTITITTREDGDCVEVDVADDGPGIPPDVRRRVFDPFFTTKDVGRGTGLGLDTARRIVVDRHHGSLTVESSVSEPTGTVFRVRIPKTARP